MSNHILNNPPAISIIIPVYNVEKYLRQCLDSAKNQTLINIEIICIDDGSTDNSGVILDEYATQDKRFVVVHQTNAGQSVARNKGIELAQGEYIAFLDSDDWLEPDMCETSYVAATKNNSEVLQFQIFIEGNSFRFPESITEIRHQNCSAEEKLRCICESSCVIWNRLYKREFLIKNKFRYLTGYNFEDNHFAIKVALFAKQIDVIQNKLLHYRCGVGYSFTSQKEWFYLQHIKVFLATYKELMQYNIPECFMYYCKCNVFIHLWGLYICNHKDIHNENLIAIIYQIRDIFGWNVIDKAPWQYRKNVILIYRVCNRNMKYLTSLLCYKLFNPFWKLYQHFFFPQEKSN